MDKQLGKELRKTFEEMMKTMLPSFQRVKQNNSPNGSRTFRSSLCNDLYAYIELQPSQKFNWFAVELAVSLSDSFPSSCLVFVESKYNLETLQELFIKGKGSVRFFLGECNENTGQFSQGQWKVSAQRRVDDPYSLNEAPPQNFGFDFDSFSKPPPVINDDDKALIKTSLDKAFNLLDEYGKTFFSDAMVCLSDCAKKVRRRGGE